ncbi:MAG: cupredoxin domain-containing protein [Salinibacter sp.]
MSRFDFAALPGALSRAAFLAGLALVLLACGSDKSKTGGTTKTSETASASPDTIRVTMKDYAYQPSNITVPAGKQVTLTFTNEGSVEHYFVVGDTIASNKDGFQQNLFSGVSIEKNKQTDEHEEEEHEKEKEHEEGEEHHEYEFELPPGGSGSLTFTLPPSKAGTYTIACFETTGNEKHYDMGMKGTLTVTASAEN